MTDTEQISKLITKVSQLEIQVRIIGDQLATEKERVRTLETEVRILKEGGNL